MWSGLRHLSGIWKNSNADLWSEILTTQILPLIWYRIHQANTVTEDELSFLT